MPRVRANARLLSRAARLGRSDRRAPRHVAGLRLGRKVADHAPLRRAVSEIEESSLSVMPKAS